MKKYIIGVLFIVLSIAGFSQPVIQLRCGFYPNGQPGKIYRDTVYSLSRTAGQYFNSFGEFHSLSDTVRAMFTLTTTGTSGPATYNPATGAWNIPQYGGGGGSGWALTGNSAISRTDYLGSADTSQVHIKRAGVDQIVLDTTNNILFGNIPRALIRDSSTIQLPYKGLSFRRFSSPITNGVTIKLDSVTNELEFKGSSSGFKYTESGVNEFKVTNNGVGTFNTSVSAPVIIGTSGSGAVADFRGAGSAGTGTVFLTNVNSVGGTGYLYGTNNVGTIYAGFKFTVYNGSYVDRWWMMQDGALNNTGTYIPSAVVALTGTTTRGFLGPTLTTTQKNAIVSPAEGLEVYDLTLHQKSYWNGTVWINY